MKLYVYIYRQQIENCLQSSQKQPMTVLTVTIPNFKIWNEKITSMLSFHIIEGEKIN